MVIELKDKINSVGLSTEPHVPASAAPAWRDQVTQGLIGLGWPAKDADAACTEVEPLLRDDPSTSVAVLMRAALQTLARR
jgi:Holliday junction DNA helicase RuvA